MTSRNLFISIALIVVVLLNVGCYKAGTLGGGDLHQFDCTRESLQSCLDSIVFRNYSLAPPFKWLHYDNWNSKGYDFLQGVVFYHDQSDGGAERMYYLTLVSRDLQDTLWTKPSYLAVRSIFIQNNDGVFWRTMREVDEKERELAEKRMEILTTTFAQSCGCNRLEIMPK